MQSSLFAHLVILLQQFFGPFLFRDFLSLLFSFFVGLWSLGNGNVPREFQEERSQHMTVKLKHLLPVFIANVQAWTKRVFFYESPFKLWVEIFQTFAYLSWSPYFTPRLFLLLHRRNLKIDIISICRQLISQFFLLPSFFRYAGRQIFNAVNHIFSHSPLYFSLHFSLYFHLHLVFFTIKRFLPMLPSVKVTIVQIQASKTFVHTYMHIIKDKINSQSIHTDKRILFGLYFQQIELCIIQLPCEFRFFLVHGIGHQEVSAYFKHLSSQINATNQCILLLGIQWMHGMIILYELGLHLSIWLLLCSELLLMEELDDIIHRQEQINSADHQTNNGFIGDRMSYLRIEDQLPSSSQYQSSIDQLHSSHAQLSVYVLVDT